MTPMDPFRKRNDEEETVELERPDVSTRLFALQHGAEVVAKENSGLVVVRHRRPDRDVFGCVSYLARCREPYNEQAKAMIANLTGRYDGGKVPLQLALKVQASVNEWLIDTIRRECKCSKFGFVDGKDVKLLESVSELDQIIGTIAGMAALLCPPAGAIALGMTAGILFLDSIRLNHLAKDPPDPNFTALPSLASFDLPDVDLSTTPPAVAASTMRMAQEVGEGVAACQALVAALERSQGAELAGDIGAQSRQLGAAAEFAERLADSLDGRVAVRTEFVAALRSAGIVKFITMDDAVDLIGAGIPAEPPTAFREAIEHFGGVGLDVRESWQRTFARPADAVGVFPESLNASRLADAEAVLGASLRESAVRWRG